jgi:predicted dehydrogenase
VLQVGHLERFNPAVMALGSMLDRPMFIECHRLAPYQPRGTDVSVILDLMIHDIDIIQDVVKSPVREVWPIGVPVLNTEIDIANARIAFDNGTVANVTASRVSTKTERKMRVFQHNAYIVVDFLEKTLATYHCAPGGQSDPPAIQGDLAAFDQGDALLAEIESFRTSILEGSPPLVSGEDGARALETAIRIARQMQIPGAGERGA